MRMPAAFYGDERQVFYVQAGAQDAGGTAVGIIGRMSINWKSNARLVVNGRLLCKITQSSQP
jgi:hypothetical protein